MSQEAKYVIFGTGQLGLAIMEVLLAQGKALTLVNRRGQVSEPLPSGVQIVRGDATNPSDVARLCAQAEVVFHCAQPAYYEWPQKFPPITQGILEGVAQTKARLIFGDNLYMYGPTNGQPIHEGLPYAATGHKGRTRAAMATMLLDAHQAGKVQVAIGRASDFYGPRVTASALGEILFAAALAGKPVNVLGNPDLPHTYTYIHDFARALVTLSEHEEAFGKAWHVPNAPTVTTRQFADMVAQAIGQPVKIRPAGRLLVSLLGMFNKDMREFNEMMYEFTEPYVVDHSQFAQAFGSHVTPHEEAIRTTLTWYRTRG
ncbi:MAG: NAD-dependent epimerase/dehydratase family protein [Ardenticatenaceae bacterium]|nr:NAD-dependent epimerase/dehydratase family protein [Ardenticatenaceae bacterium]